MTKAEKRTIFISVISTVIGGLALAMITNFLSKKNAG